MANKILQGTTPTLTIKIPSDILVAQITALELTFKHNKQTSYYHLSDVTINTTNNTISYIFTEAQTLAFNPELPLIWQLRIVTANGIFGTEQNRIDILDLISTEVLSS